MEEQTKLAEETTEGKQLEMNENGHVWREHIHTIYPKMNQLLTL